MATSNMTTFMVISDTHNLESTAELSALSQPLPKLDVLLHCGDLTQVGGLSAYKKALRLLGEFQAELKLVIAGNHDISLDGEYWHTHLDQDDEPEEHDQAIEIMTGPLAKAAGVTYLTEGLHNFTLQSGQRFSIYASPYQPECGNWAFGYQRTQDRFNIPPTPGMESIVKQAIPDDVDIVMTHGPPRGVLDFVPSKNEHAGCDALLHAMQRVRPLMHCFGHIHESHGLGIKRWINDVTDSPAQVVRVRRAGTVEEEKRFSHVPGSQTLMVNAAIMDERNCPSHAPWIVELELGQEPWPGRAFHSISAESERNADTSVPTMCVGLLPAYLALTRIVLDPATSTLLCILPLSCSIAKPPKTVKVPTVPAGEETVRTQQSSPCSQPATISPNGVTTVPFADDNPNSPSKGCHCHVLNPGLVGVTPSRYSGNTYVGAPPQGCASDVKSPRPGEPSASTYSQLAPEAYSSCTTICAQRSSSRVFAAGKLETP